MLDEWARIDTRFQVVANRIHRQSVTMANDVFDATSNVCLRMWWHVDAVQMTTKKNEMNENLLSVFSIQILRWHTFQNHFAYKPIRFSVAWTLPASEWVSVVFVRNCVTCGYWICVRSLLLCVWLLLGNIEVAVPLQAFCYWIQVSKWRKRGL